MNVRKFLITSAILSSAAVVGMFVFRVVLYRLSERWIEQPVELSLSQRIMFGIAAAWGRLWVIGVPMIFCLVTLFVGTVFLLLGTLRKRENRTAD